MISKTERAELRSIVKQQFRVLRLEVDQREAELMAQLEEDVAEYFAEDDRLWAVTQHRIHEIGMEANRQINDVLREGGYAERGHTEQMYVRVAQMAQPKGKRQEMLRLGESKVRAQVKTAKLQLDRQEADLLRSLAVGAVESDEARTFLSDIPTVAQLVPEARLIELDPGATS